jgi:dTDP-4-amino-4,6-dideoxygalactose transaminase
MKTIPLVNLERQHRLLEIEVADALRETLKNCHFILGEDVDRFEVEFSKFIGIKHAIGVGNGLEALKLALCVLGIGLGDEIIIPANSFIATALAVTATGASPVFVDCFKDNYNIDYQQIEEKITPKTKAIIPVHLTGQSAEMTPIIKIAHKHNLHIIEDAAQAHGASYKSQKCGSMGIMGCFSFYPGKNLGACGDGGMIVTNDDSIRDKLRQLRNYGQLVKYEHPLKGTNSRLDTLQASILRIKLRYLQQWNNLRQEHATYYHQALQNIGDIKFQSKIGTSTHVYHLFIIETEYRDKLKSYLESRGIATGIHYPIPIPFQQAYSEMNHKSGDFVNSEYLSRRMLSLPMFPELERDELEFVSYEIKNFFNKA